jgi:hypothetical protein
MALNLGLHDKKSPRNHLSHETAMPFWYTILLIPHAFYVYSIYLHLSLDKGLKHTNII